jgi:hypothetical protein
MSAADQILRRVFTRLRIAGHSDAGKYRRLDRIVLALAAINRRAGGLSVATTGTITERLCELAVRACLPDNYYRLGPGWEWLGDFVIQGYPLNIIVSVKSFKARERLLVSGTGSPLVPAIGFGLFNDPAEFAPARLKAYLMRAFVAIYLPRPTYRRLPIASRRMTNPNGRPLVRPAARLVRDLRGGILDVGRKQMVDIARF